MNICDICLKIVPYTEPFKIKFNRKWKTVDICPDCGKKIVEKGNNHEEN